MDNLFSDFLTISIIIVQITIFYLRFYLFGLCPLIFWILLSKNTIHNNNPSLLLCIDFRLISWRFRKRLRWGSWYNIEPCLLNSDEISLALINYVASLGKGWKMLGVINNIFGKYYFIFFPLLPVYI